jgi:undecaprenyl-diphosphatase
MGIDTFVFEWVQQIRTPGWDVFMKQITLLGNWPVVFALAAIASLLFFRFHQKEKALSLLLNVWVGGLIVVLIKYSIQRLRPEFGLVEEIGFSFPSAHAFLSVTFYGYLLYLLLKTNLRRSVRWLGAVWLFALVVLISFSRIYLGVHWFSDVVGGVAMALVWMGVVGRYTPSPLKGE